MPLATKNNALIVKDGKVAENCNCCGGWYCCEDKIGQCRDRLSDVLRITTTITAQDWRKQDLATGCPCANNGFEWISGTYIFPGNDYAGTFTLTGTRRQRFVSAESNEEIGKWWEYEYVFPPDRAGCGGARLSLWVNVRLPGDPFQTTSATLLTLDPMILYCNRYRYFIASTGTPSVPTKTIFDMQCQTQTSAYNSNQLGSFCTGSSAAFDNRFTGVFLTQSVGYSDPCNIAPKTISGTPVAAFSGTTECFTRSGTIPASTVSESGSPLVSCTISIEQV